MEKIASTTGILCIAVFIMGIFYQLGGFEKTSGIVKFIMSLCVLATMLKNVKGFEPDIDYSQIYDNSFENTYTEELNNEVLSKTEYELEQIIKKRLDEKNISYNQISVHILEQNGVVSVDEISVEGTDADENDILDLIADMTDSETRVKTGE